MTQANNTNSSKLKLNNVAFGANNFLRWSRSAMLRGGRVTKFKGIAASFSPELGLIYPGSSPEAVGGQGSSTLSLARRLLQWSAAPAALLAASSPAFAQDQDECVEVTPDNFVCEDNGDPATVTQDLGVLEQDVNVLLQDGFEVDTSDGTGDGISIGEAYDVTIAQESGTSTITGFDDGISVTGSYGNIDITTGGDVTGVNGDGIRADNNAADGIDEFITIDSRAGTVRGGQDGIEVDHFGGGDLSITTGDVDGEGGDGIDVGVSAAAGDVVIDTSAGEVNAFQFGVFVDQDGPGDVTVTTADVTTEVNTGIRVSGDGGNIAINTAAGTVDGSQGGITVFNSGPTGNISVTTADVVSTSFDTDAVYVSQRGGDVSVDTSAGEVSGAAGGVEVRNRGTGDTTITTGAITSSRGYGVEGVNGASAGDLTIDTSAGAVVGRFGGISASNQGTGNTSITTADVDGYGELGVGIDVRNGSTAGDLIIDSSAGSVTGQDEGINALNTGSGIVSVVTGNVTGQDGDGVRVGGNANVSAILVDTSAGAVSGAQYGVNVDNNGYGAVTVITGDVYAANRDGIDVSDDGENGAGLDGTDITIDSSAGSVTGGDKGIEARNFDTGDLTIITGDVTGLSEEGIRAVNASGTGDLIIDSSAGSVNGDVTGIRATNNGTGDTLVTTADVIGQNSEGIYVRNGTGAGDLTIDTTLGTVTSNGPSDNGIFVNNAGSGAISITTADVTGYSAGVGGNNSGTDFIVDTTAGAVLAEEFGLEIDNFGSGITSITSANVTGIADFGISVRHYGTDLIINSTAGTVSGGGSGIYSSNRGTGDTTITTGDVESVDDDGINAENRIDAGDLSIDSSAGAVTGGTNGIFARNNGTGSVTIVTASVTGQTGNGVDIINDIIGGELVLDTSAGPVEGAQNGIRARNYGDDQNATITTADVTGLGADGINVRDDGELGNGADITINTTLGTVTGAEDGIDAFNFDTGDLSITTANVDGEAGNGIYATNVGLGTGDLTIDSSAGSVTGATSGIRATNNDTGDTIIRTGNVSGGSIGVVVVNSNSNANSGSLAIDSSAGFVSGSHRGISVDHYGTGDISVITADVSATDGDAVNVNDNGEEGAGVDVTIDSTQGTVTGSRNGIYAANSGTGDLSITTADVTGTIGDGIEARNLDSTTGNLTIDSTAGAVASQNATGVFVRNEGSGDVTITTADVSGRALNTIGGGYGIFADSEAGSITINSAAGSVSGGDGGIFARVDGGNGISITTADVSSSGRNGIEATLLNSDGDLTIDSTAGRVEANSFGSAGISATNQGSGTTSITTADVFGSTTGIDASIGSQGSDLTIDTSAGTVDGGFYGIVTNNAGNGRQSITTGDITTFSGDAIYASNTGATSTDLIIDTLAGEVMGAGSGISAVNAGTGYTLITTAGVTGASNLGNGIQAINDPNAGDLTVDSSAGTVTGGNRGIFVLNFGVGAVTITTAGVTGEAGDGVLVYNDIIGDDLIIDTSAGPVEGAQNGILARNYADEQNATITTADVTGLAADGINVRDDGEIGNGADITIDTTLGTVTGAEDGIDAFNFDTGHLSITTADVVSETGTGIAATNNGLGTGDLTIDSSAGSVTGATNGIRGSNLGSGSTSVTTANVVGSTGDGVYMVTGADTMRLDIDTSDGATIGANRGIYANHGGSDDLTITVGNVTGQGAEGILATTNQATAAIFVSGGEGVDSNVIGATTGIALSTGGGDITVSGLDSVTGQAGDALNLVSNGGNIAVSDIGTITGLGGNGIFANADSGNITIDNVGLIGGITATGGVGIAAYADNGGTITIGTSGAVSGKTYGVDGSAQGGTGDITINTTNYAVNAAVGIRAVNLGSGNTSVTTADVTGTGGEGINASADGGDVLIETVAGTITGLTDGIEASTTQDGNIVITTANVTGTTAAGISAIGDGESIAIDSTAGRVSGGTNGIQASNGISGSITITTADVSGAAGNGIEARSAEFGDGLTIDSSAGSVEGGLSGIVANNNGGAFNITTGNVSGEVGDGISLDNSDFSGDLSVNTAAGDVVGAQDGIDVDNNAGFSGTATIVTSSVTGGDNGIAVRNFADGLTINSAAGTVTGGLDGITADHRGSGALAIITAGVDGGQNGITARSNGIDLLLNSAAGAVSGGAVGIDALHEGTGTVTIIAADVTANGGDGINAANAASGADLIINSAAGTVTGSEAGIDAESNGAGALIITSASAVGTAGDGIAADGSAAGTDVLINSVAGTVSGGQNGIAASNLGTGGVIIVSAGAEGAAADGINAASSAAGLGVTIDSSAGPVSGGTNGVAAVNQGSSVLLITTADATGVAGAGILASNTGLDTIINSTAGTVSGGTDGISAVNEAGLLAVNTAGVSGAAGQGISAVNTGTELIINSSAGAVSGSQNGILADNQGTSILNITTADVSGENAAGIAATNTGTDLLVFSDTGSVSGQTDGISAINSGSGFLSVISGNVDGAAGQGISAVNSGTDLVIDSSAGAVTGNINGVDADNSAGTGIVRVTTADVIGTAAIGILATSTGRSIDVNSNAGAVTGATIGVQAQQSGAGDITVLVNEVTGAVGIDTNATSGATEITLGSTAAVTGTAGFGIDARSTGGAITVQGSSGSVTGATDGIYVRPTTGDITIANIDLVEGLAGDGLDLLTVGGAVTVSDIDAVIGTGGNGITATTSGGVIDIQNAGDITGSVSGIAATTSGAGTIGIIVGGQTTGAQNGIDVSSAGGTVSISNTGALSGGDFAVLASGTDTGAISLDNAGTLASAVQLSAFDDQFLNTGTFNAAGVSDFGEGEDVLTNSGTLFIAASAQFARLEQLQSSGLIDLSNGLADGALSIAGDFAGDGGQLGLDVSFAAGTGDLLTIDGAATGNTGLVINVVYGDFSLGNDVLIVDAGAGTEASAFSVLEGAGSATPFLAFELNFDAATNDFLVAIELEDRIFESTKIAEAAQALWYRSADAWADHRASARFGGSDASPAWAVAYGSVAQRDEQFADPTGFGLADTNLDYEQDFFGFQGGGDYKLGDSLTLGVTGGYLSSSFRQDLTGTRAVFDVLNIGLSASFETDGFFADALLKYDSISGDLSDPAQGGFTGQLDGQAFGARIDAGYRIGGERFYVEPRVSLNLQRTDLDDLIVEAASFEFDNLNGLRGTAGIRLGGYGKTGGSTRIGYFLDASAAREFRGEADVRFRVLGDIVEFQNNPLGTYGHVEAGITLDGEGPISGFFQVEGDIGSDYSSFGSKVGVKIQF